MRDGLDRLLRPRSIALLGASASPHKFGGRPLAALRRFGFGGELFVVNPNHDEILGVRCLRAAAELPHGVDLAVCLLPAERALPAIETCAERGVGAVAVFSGGFSEAGAEGLRREAELLRLAREAGMRVLGPNCPGFANLIDGIVCSASAYATRETMVAGQLSFVFQSGAVAGIVCDRAFDAGIGVAFSICAGNEADVTVAELVRFLVREGSSRGIGLFLEGVGGGESLVSALREARRAGLGLACLKVGRSPRAREIAASHTAAIVGSDEAFDALCASVGILRAADYAELLELTALAASRPWTGRRVAVVGASGGMNAVLADAADAEGLQLPPLSSATVARLAELTPDFGAAANPVDISSLLLIEPGHLGAAVEVVAEDPAIDGVVVAVGDHPPELSERLAAAVLAASARITKPLVVQWSAGSLSAPGFQALGRGGVPVLAEPGRCLRGLAAAIAARRARASTRSVEPARPERVDWAESDAKRLLAAIGIPSPPRPAPGEEAVVKADCVGVAHKTELGAVSIGVAAEDVEQVRTEVVQAAEAALGADRVRGALVEARVRPIAELVLSVHRDPQLGAIVTIGAGGELVEIAADAVSRLAPVDEEEADAMVGELRAHRLLEGFRGRPRGDRAALARAVAALSALGASWGDALGMIEVNPLAVLERGVAALDVVIEVNREVLQ